MEIQKLGHVVRHVRDLERSERFSTGVLGLAIAARMDSPPSTFSTLGNHHGLAITAVGPDAPDPDENTIEVSVDTSDVWQTDPQSVATVAALAR